MIARDELADFKKSLHNKASLFHVKPDERKSISSIDRHKIKILCDLFSGALTTLSKMIRSCLPGQFKIMVIMHAISRNFCRG